MNIKQFFKTFATTFEIFIKLKFKSGGKTSLPKVLLPRIYTGLSWRNYALAKGGKMLKKLGPRERAIAIFFFIAGYMLGVVVGFAVAILNK